LPSLPVTLLSLVPQLDSNLLRERGDTGLCVFTVRNGDGTQTVTITKCTNIIDTIRNIPQWFSSLFTSHEHMQPSSIPLTPAPCEDGNQCTVDDHYLNGVCTAGPQMVCDDGNPETVDTCDPRTGCVYTPIRKPAANGTPCNDGNACTVNEYFQNGACTGGSPLC
jgi:hypothetical protein